MPATSVEPVPTTHRAASYANGKFYVAGNTASASGITPSGYDTTFNGGFDGYVAAFSIESPPVVTVNASVLSYAESVGPLAVDSSLSVVDEDSASLASATVRITANYINGEDLLAFNNVNPWGITGTWASATGTLTLTGVSSVANYQAALRSVTYQNTSEKPSARTRTVTFTAADGGLTSAGAVRQITVSSLNDPAVNIVPGTQPGTEDTPVVFSAGNGNQISVADVDAGTAPIQVTLTATNGRLTLAQTSGLAFVSGDGSADVAMTFTGTIANINSALNGLRFDPNANYDGLASVQIATNDLGNSGSDGAQITNNTVNIDFGSVNDAPVQSVPGAQSTAQNTPLTFSSGTGNAITVADIDAGSGELKVTLSGANGTLTLGSIAGLISVLGNGTGAVTLVGTLPNLNAALDGLRFTPSFNYSGPAGLTVATNDQGNTGSGGALGRLRRDCHHGVAEHRADHHAGRPAARLRGGGTGDPGGCRTHPERSGQCDSGPRSGALRFRLRAGCGRAELRRPARDHRRLGCNDGEAVADRCGKSRQLPDRPAGCVLSHLER